MTNIKLWHILYCIQASTGLGAVKSSVLFVKNVRWFKSLDCEWCSARSSMLTLNHEPVFHLRPLPLDFGGFKFGGGGRIHTLNTTLLSAGFLWNFKLLSENHPPPPPPAVWMEHCLNLSAWFQFYEINPVVWILTFIQAHPEVGKTGESVVKIYN